jgi:hypothetical protein
MGIFIFFIRIIFFFKKIFELAILFFAFSVGCRLNFIIFIFIVIFLFKTDEFITIHKRFIISICTFITGGLFYLPIWFHYGFGLDWLDAARPIDQGFLVYLQDLHIKHGWHLDLYNFFLLFMDY